MKKLLITLFIFGLILDYSSNALADTLYDLYSDHGSPNQTTETIEKHSHKKKPDSTSQTNTKSQTYTSSGNSQKTDVYKAVHQNKDSIIEKGSQNYSDSGYAKARNLTNPLYIDNSYNTLNNHHKSDITNTIPTTGNVTFKKDIWGNINEYDSTGKKIGTYKTN